MRRISAVIALLLATGGLTALGSTPAQAATVVTVSLSGGTLTVEGTESAEGVTVSAEGSAGDYLIGIAGPDGKIAAGVGCSLRFSSYVECLTGTLPTVRASLLGGVDRFVVNWQEQFREMVFVVDGGPGNDSFEGAGAQETWIGGEGDDTLTPDRGLYLSNAGPDTFAGGPGLDGIDYLFTPGDDVSGVTVTLDGLANDGTQAEGDVDNVHPDVESVSGTNQTDVLTSGLEVHTLVGYSGNDVIMGGGGTDTLYGSGGADRIDGGDGADTIFGGSDNDTIVGGPGFDTINGDTTDLLITGNDTIDSVDGEADYVACGPGADSVSADYLDQIATQAQDNCEQVTLTQPPVVVPPPPPPGVPGAGSVKLAGKKLNANKLRTKATIAIKCSATTACSGKAVVKAGKSVVAKGKYAAAAGKTAKVSLKLTKKGRALLRKKAAVKVVLKLTPGSTAKVKLTR